MKNIKKTGFVLSKKYGDLLHITALFLFSRLIIIAGFIYGTRYLKLYNKFKYPLLRYDSFFYSSIASAGYRIYNNGKYSTVVFFPFYPLLTHFLSVVFKLSVPLSMELISNVFGYLSVIFFYKLALFYLDEKKAAKATFLFLLFPMSIYLTAAYARPVLIFFAILTFYMFKKGRIFWGAVFSGISTSVHPTGIAVSAGAAVFLCSSFFSQSKIFSNKIPLKYVIKKTLIFSLYGLISISGILLYIFYLSLFFHSPIAFVKYQNNIGYLGKMSFETQIIRAITLFPFFSAHRVFDLRLNELQFILFAVMVIISIKKKLLDAGLNFFMLILILIIYFEHIVRINYFGAAPRLVYLAFPAFYVIETLISDYISKNKDAIYYEIIVFSVFAVMLFYFSALFYRNYWIDF